MEGIYYFETSSKRNKVGKSENGPVKEEEDLSSGNSNQQKHLMYIFR